MRWMIMKKSWIIWMLMMKMTRWISECFNTLTTMNKQHEMTLRDVTSWFGNHLPFFTMCSWPSEEYSNCHCSTTGPQSTLKWCHLGRYIYYSIYGLPKVQSICCVHSNFSQNLLHLTKFGPCHSPPDKVMKWQFCQAHHNHIGMMNWLKLYSIHNM